MLIALPPAETIVGVNKFVLKKEQQIDVRVVDNSQVLIQQVNKLDRLRKNRDSQKVSFYVLLILSFIHCYMSFWEILFGVYLFRRHCVGFAEF